MTTLLTLYCIVFNPVEVSLFIAIYIYKEWTQHEYISIQEMVKFSQECSPTNTKPLEIKFKKRMKWLTVRYQKALCVHIYHI